MDLCTISGIISDALEFVEKKNSQLDRMKKLEMEKRELDKEEESKTTTEGF